MPFLVLVSWFMLEYPIGRVIFKIYPGWLSQFDNKVTVNINSINSHNVSVCAKKLGNPPVQC